MGEEAKRLPQAMRPSGRVGRIFGFVMAQLNSDACRWTVDQLRAVEPTSFLEIGFGTGRLLARAIRTFRLERACGVDPSELMVDTTRKHLRRFADRVTLDIRGGDDTSLPDGPFDAVAALHSFQFWSDPDAALARIRTRLAPGGRLVLVLRTHGGKAPEWLPNPLSRADNEIAAACKALERAGFAVTGLQGISETSQGIVAAPR
jgi:SAM-dependent methyltransferase